MSYFSIILPTFNRAHLLPKAIESVIGQTFADWELIIVDDGSTDNTRELVESYSDPRIKYIYQTNQERSAARNNGIENAQGDYICFLDSDDYFLNNKLDSLFSFIQVSSDKKAVFYDGISILQGSKLTPVTIPFRRPNETIFEFLLRNPLFSQQICGHRNIFNEYKYALQFRIGEDIELWCRIAEQYNFIPVENGFNTIIVEHEDRTINMKNGNPSLDHLKLLRYLYSLDNNHIRFSRKVKAKVLSSCYFNNAKYYMYFNKKMTALKWVIKSLFTNLTNEQSKHKVFCLFYLSVGKIPKEYNSGK